MKDSPIRILSMRKFTDEQRAKLRAVSPRIDLVEMDGRAKDANLTGALTPEFEVVYAFRGNFEIAQATGLKWVQMENAGVDHLHSTPLWSRNDITITSANGAHSPQLPEYVMSVLLAHMHRLPMTLSLQTLSHWGDNDMRKRLEPRELRGLTMGIFGYGAIGRELAQMAHAFGMRIIATARDTHGAGRYTGYMRAGVGDMEGTLPERYFTLDQRDAMLRECDVAVLILPMSPKTRHLINADALKQMKRDAVLINVGRGGLIDSAALIEAMQHNAIAAAILDVTDPEPLPADNALWRTPGVWITPHISGNSARYIDNVTDVFAENLRRYVHGEPLLNIVQRELGY